LGGRRVFIENPVNALLQDVRFSLRVLAKSPVFTTAAVLVLALGIGLNTATFSALYALGFSPRSLRAPDRLVQLYTQDKKEPTRFRAFSYDALRELREHRDLFTGVAAQKFAVVAVGEGHDARRAFSAIVSANFFDVLGVPLARGRSFSADEEAPGANAAVVVVSDRHARDSGLGAGLLGSVIRINARPFTIIGVAPEGFHGTMAMLGPDFYFPIGVADFLQRERDDEPSRPLDRAKVFDLFLTARLQDGITFTAAESALDAVAATLARLQPAEYQEKRFLLGPLPRLFPDTAPSDEGMFRVLAVILLGLTGTVLLIVSLNLAGLLLVRGHARRKEFAIRLALGGTRTRLVRQLLTEGFLLACLGGALGCVCAIWVTDLSIAAISNRLPVDILPTLRAPAAIVGATLVFCTLATLFFALGPALALSRRDLLPDLQQNAGEDTAGRRHRWLPRHPLVVAQLALSLALVIGAGLFARLVTQAGSADTGIDADRTLVAEFDASLTPWEPARRLEVFRTLRERLAALPGVSSATFAASTPFTLSGDNRTVRRAGTRPTSSDRPATPAEGRAFTVPFNAVGADYFSTLDQPLLRGRAFTRFETDHAGARPVVIIDEALAAQLFPGEDALRRPIEWVQAGSAEPDAAASPAEAIEIVGIVRSRQLELFEKQSTGAIYVPFAQSPAGNLHFLLRSTNAGEATLNALREPVRRELQTAADDVPLFRVRTFREHQSDSLELWVLHRTSLLATAFGAVAAVIAIIGLYGAKAYGVSRRTREIGIRLALGAEPARLRNLILREGLASGFLGVSLGLLLGGALGRLLGSVIVDFNSLDPTVFGIAACALFAAAFAASWLPARQATKISPMTALRSE